MSSTEYILAMTTVSSEPQARDLARQLIENRLAACVNQIHVASTYRWKGTLEEEPEILLLIKTTRARQADLQEALLETHPYELPEFITLPLTGGSEPYLKWLQDSV
ncbi:MAG: divalent-cation tolerance protein CutA [Gammaproteobacteria bacterium]|nr:divalent-cation tolerance protein CutA [Gammaproteobacteria bacterium]